MESQLDNYIESLTETDTPKEVLAKIFILLFGRELKNREWDQLQKLIDIYGRWRVLTSFLRASGNLNFDSNTGNAWSYFTAVCVGLMEDEKDAKELIFRQRMFVEQTKRLVLELSRPIPMIKIKDKAWLTCNSD